MCSTGKIFTYSKKKSKADDPFDAILCGMKQLSSLKSIESFNENEKKRCPEDNNMPYDKFENVLSDVTNIDDKSKNCRIRSKKLNTNYNMLPPIMIEDNYVTRSNDGLYEELNSLNITNSPIDDICKIYPPDNDKEVLSCILSEEEYLNVKNHKHGPSDKNLVPQNDLYDPPHDRLRHFLLSSSNKSDNSTKQTDKKIPVGRQARSANKTSVLDHLTIPSKPTGPSQYGIRGRGKIQKDVKVCTTRLLLDESPIFFGGEEINSYHDVPQSNAKLNFLVPQKPIQHLLPSSSLVSSSITFDHSMSSKENQLLPMQRPCDLKISEDKFSLYSPNHLSTNLNLNANRLYKIKSFDPQKESTPLPSPIPNIKERPASIKVPLAKCGTRESRNLEKWGEEEEHGMGSRKLTRTNGPLTHYPPSPAGHNTSAARDQVSTCSDYEGRKLDTTLVSPAVGALDIVRKDGSISDWLEQSPNQSAVANQTQARDRIALGNDEDRNTSNVGRDPEPREPNDLAVELPFEYVMADGDVATTVPASINLDSKMFSTTSTLTHYSLPTSYIDNEHSHTTRDGPSLTETWKRSGLLNDLTGTRLSSANGHGKSVIEDGNVYENDSSYYDDCESESSATEYSSAEDTEENEVGSCDPGQEESCLWLATILEESDEEASKLGNAFESHDEGSHDESPLAQKRGDSDLVIGDKSHPNTSDTTAPSQTLNTSSTRISITTHRTSTLANDGQSDSHSSESCGSRVPSSLRLSSLSFVDAQDVDLDLSITNNTGHPILPSIGHLIKWERVVQAERLIRLVKSQYTVPTHARYEGSSLALSKIGEGSYGEVYGMYHNSSNTKDSNSHDILAIFKVIPIQEETGTEKCFDDIVAELTISRLIGTSPNNESMVNVGKFTNPGLIHTSGFIRDRNIYCCQGKYPPELLESWDLYLKQNPKLCLNPRPNFFGEHQFYLVLEQDYGGEPLEDFKFQSIEQIKSFLIQLLTTLDIAERSYYFEHRDLHWGNILIKRVSYDTVLCFTHMDGTQQLLPSNGIKMSIIDFSLSRLTINNRIYFKDLSTESDLFKGKGDYQFEIYRLMKKHNKNDWRSFCPYSNVLWINYVIRQLLDHKFKGKDLSITAESLKSTRKLLSTYNRSIARDCSCSREALNIFRELFDIV